MDLSPISLSDAPTEAANKEKVADSPLSLVATGKQGDRDEDRNLSEAESESAKKV